LGKNRQPGSPLGAFRGRAPPAEPGVREGTSASSCNLHDGTGDLQFSNGLLLRIEPRNPKRVRGLTRATLVGTGLATLRRQFQSPTFGEANMTLIWFPALFVLGLATFGVLFAFVSACERV